MIVLELNETLVQRGAAEQQEGKRGFQITELQERDRDVKTGNLFSLKHERCLETEPSPG